MQEPFNNYDQLAGTYGKTSVKPDKLFSTLPTILAILGDLGGKTVLDLGCGSGFFTEEFARKGAKRVIGIDSSVEQIRLAKARKFPTGEYQLGNIFTDAFPKADIIVAAYVLNYAMDINHLRRLLEKAYDSLSFDGMMVAVVDLPEGENLRKFGAVKEILGKKEDGAKIKISLYNLEELICVLYSVYFTPQTIENVFKNVGFQDITWRMPVVSEEGIAKFGKEFWKGYVELPELGYITAIKK